MPCGRPHSTAWGRMSKLRKTHNRYKRCANDVITYRGPIGVCTRTTPAASFSINITWTYLGPEIGQSNSRAAIMHYHTCIAKPYFKEFTDYLIRKRGSLRIVSKLFWEFSPDTNPELVPMARRSCRVA